jgi:ATP-dependent DNA helicase RecG
MTDQELERLLADLESDRVERKASESDKEKIKRAICAFANDLPGHGEAGIVFVGVNDDGTPASWFQVTDEILTALSALTSSGQIQPIPSVVVQKRKLSGREIAVIIVAPSFSPPVRYDGRAYVRRGPSTQLASRDDERKLTERRRSHDLPFDLQPVPGASVADLDLDLFQRTYLPFAVAPEILEENERTTAQQLSSLRLQTKDGAPTVTGILTVGKSPRAFLYGAYVQFLRIDGMELTDPIKDQKEIDGPLSELLRRLDELADVHVSISADFTSGPTEVRRPDYPIVAVQQVLRNAVLHRNYEGTNAPVRFTWFSDRIEIVSPGGPYGQVSVENFGTAGITDYRNPHIAEAMKVLGYVQRFGVGIALARRELAKNGNPPPEFVPTGSHVLAVLRRR